MSLRYTFQGSREPKRVILDRCVVFEARVDH